MAELIRWKDIDLTLKSEYIPNRLWLAASIDLLLSGKTLLSSGGQLKHKGSLSGQFNHDGTSHQIRLDWGLFVFRSIPCTLHIDGQEIAQRNIKPENGLIHGIAVALLYIIIIACITFGMFTVSVMKVLINGS